MHLTLGLLASKLEELADARARRDRVHSSWICLVSICSNSPDTERMRLRFLEAQAAVDALVEEELL